MGDLHVSVTLERWRGFGWQWPRLSRERWCRPAFGRVALTFGWPGASVELAVEG